MLKYQIVKSSDYMSLTNIVNGCLKDGWELYGELNVVYVHSGTNGTTYYHQVMVKHEVD